MNEMRKVRDDYEKLFYEIEGPNSEARVEWPIPNETSTSILCYPRFVSKKSGAISSAGSLVHANTNDQGLSNRKPSSNVLDYSSKKSRTPEMAKTQATENLNKSSAATASNELEVFDDMEKARIEFKLDDAKVKSLQLANLKNMNKKELVSVREAVSFELLWIQQAIQSRVQVNMIFLFYSQIFVSNTYFSLSSSIWESNKIFKIKKSQRQHYMVNHISDRNLMHLYF